MSAIPNIPESVVRAVSSSPDEVKSNSRSDVKENGISYVEDATVTSTSLPNAGSQADGASHKYSWKLHGATVENHRPIKVIVIGAGYSGIYCGIRIPERIRNFNLTIYEKNAGYGGAWYENRYPGCACDVPSHSYQYSFDPNPAWSSLYSPSHEIRAYLNRIALKYGVDRFTRLRHEVVNCVFDEDEGKWHVRVKDLTSGYEFEDVSDVLISARGNLNNISWPKIDGLQSFKGEIMHSARWNEGYDFRNKRIGVIGSGSSAIQIIPNLQRLPDTQLSCFIRSPTWISPPFSEHLFASLGLVDFNIPPSRIQQFLDDPQNYHNFRLQIEEDGNNIHGVTIKNTPLQLEGQRAFEKTMRERLATKPEIYNKLLPSFAPGCRRLTPGPGFLEALCQDNVDFVSRPISRIESTGVRTSDGELHEIDVLVCATGFHVSAPPPFPVVGLKGRTIKQHWSKRASTYLSLTTNDFPNHFLMLGPNAAIGSGSLTMMIESVGDYIVKCVRKLQKENLKSMCIKGERVEDFLEYADRYFEKTVFQDECRSWYKTRIEEENGGGGKKAVRDVITGLWPGSTLHCMEALRSPRWEDYDYEYLPEPEDNVTQGVDSRPAGTGDKRRVNAMGWLGNGWSQNQVEQKHTAWYLEPRFLDPMKPSTPRPEENAEFAARAFSH
ncbi:MAG: hypothetical protein M1821_003608 [Bathelium mastoideum]|nr:MAG: hypothetical protein M1821_003608 [Bathelium mastoideum]KAI9684896.1 MAG: hypothetical protein M1822_005545 [Bathelium mastoideum]